MKKFAQLFVDADTQNDFMDQRGTLCAPAAHEIFSNLGRLINFAAGAGIPVLSSVCAHKEGDPAPHHCVMDSWGYLKLGFTLLPGRVTLPAGVTVQNVPSLLDSYQQIILQKHRIEVFTNVNADALVNGVEADRWVVFGVTMEYSVKAWLEGLLARNKAVTLVTDAIRSVKQEDGAQLIQSFRARGLKTITTDEILQGK